MLLARQLGLVIEGVGATRGRAVVMTGRRRVGKSRLVQEFCDRSRVPYVVFQATRGRNAVAERADFTGTLAQSALPGGGAGGRAAGRGLESGAALTGRRGSGRRSEHRGDRRGAVAG